MDQKLSPADMQAASRLLAVGLAHRLLRDDLEARFQKAGAPRGGGASNTKTAPRPGLSTNGRRRPMSGGRCYFQGSD